MPPILELARELTEAPLMSGATARKRRSKRCSSGSTAATCRLWKWCGSGFPRWRRCCRRTAPQWPKAAWTRAADARNVRQLGYRLALIGTALMSREDPAALLSGNLRCGTDSAALNGYTRAHVDQNLRHHQCRCDQRRRRGQCGCDRLRVCAEPAASDSGAGGATRGARAAGDFAYCGRAASAANESGRDLPDPQAGLFSDRCRGFARIEDPGA